MTHLSPPSGIGGKQCYDLIKNILKTLHSFDAEFPLQYAICMIEIAQNNGITASDLSNKTGIHKSTLSRIIGALSNKRQRGAPFDLITVTQSQTCKRTKEIYLTAKGNNFMRSLQLASQKQI